MGERLVYSRDDDGCHHVRDSNGASIAQCSNRADAKMFVREHNALLDLKRVIDEEGEFDMERIVDWMDRLNAIIALAFEPEKVAEL
jgi:hypothetical protein